MSSLPAIGHVYDISVPDSFVCTCYKVMYMTFQYLTEMYIHFCTIEVIPIHHTAPIERVLGPQLVPGLKLELGIQLITS